MSWDLSQAIIDTYTEQPTDTTMTLSLLKKVLAPIAALKYRSGDCDATVNAKRTQALDWISATGAIEGWVVVYRASIHLDGKFDSRPAEWQLQDTLKWSDDHEAWVSVVNITQALTPDWAWAFFEGCPVYEVASSFEPGGGWDPRINDEGRYTVRAPG